MCACVCVCVCMCVCSLCVCVCVCVCVHACMHSCVCVHACMHACVGVCVCSMCAHAHISVSSHHFTAWRMKKKGKKKKDGGWEQGVLMYCSLYHIWLSFCLMAHAS